MITGKHFHIRVEEQCRYLLSKAKKMNIGLQAMFFDKILVNAPDPEIRRNRFTLLHSLLAEFSSIADFSEIVTSS